MSNATATREWTTEAGTHVTASVELILRRTLWADGDKIEIDCCEMGPVTARPTGHAEQDGYIEFAEPKTQGGNVYVAAIGKLGLTSSSNKIVQDMIAEIKEHPAWVAKQETIDRNQREIAEMEASRRRHPGWCDKCGSYCYGDCEVK
jgi:hypothetical protein